MDPANISKQEPLPRLRELCMISICDKYSTDEIKKLNLPSEVKDVLLQKKNLDITFNKLSNANGRGLHTAMYLFASRGKEILPYLNEKLLSAKSWRERLLVKAIKAMILNADLMLEHNHDRASCYAQIIPQNVTQYDESGSGLRCDYVLARVLCMMPIDPSTWRSLDSDESTPQEIYWDIFDRILKVHYNHPEVIPTLVWTLVHSDLPMTTYESLFRVLSASQKNHLVQIIQSNALKMTVEQVTRVMRVIAAVNERSEIASHAYADILQAFMETNIAYLLSSEHLLIESIFNGFGVLQYMPGLEFIFKILLIAVEQYRNSAVFSAKLLSPGLIRQSIIQYGDRAVPFLQETVKSSENLMAQVVGHGVLFEIECALAAHDFYQTVTDYLERHRMNVNGTGYVAFHQASHRYQIDFVIPTSLKVPFYLHCEAFLTHRKINPANAPCFVVNEFGRKVLAKRFALESPHVQVKILDSLIGHYVSLGEFFVSVVTTSKLDLKVLLKVIEVSVLSSIKSEALFSLLTEKLNQLAAKSDAQKVLYGHELLNHLAPIVLSLGADVHIIPADALSQILSTQSDFNGEYSLHYFCAHYLIQFHKDFSHLHVILRAVCASPTGREIARELYNVAKGPLFVEALERELSAMKKSSAPVQAKSIIKKNDEFNMDDVKCRVLCEYLLIKLRNVELYNNFRLGMEKPRPSFSQRGGPQLVDFERAARFFIKYPEDVPLLEYEVIFPDLKAVYHPSLAALALAHLKNKSSLPVLISFLYSTHYDIKVPYRALELYGEEAVSAIKAIVDKTTDRAMANSLRKVLQQISHKQMSLDSVLESIEKYNAETMPKSDLLSCLEAVKNYPDSVLVKVMLFKWIPLQTDMEIKSRAIEVFWSWKVSGDIADFCSEHLQYYDKENNINLSEPAFKVFSAHTGVESGVRFLINKISSHEHASGCLLGIGKIYENAYICHERDFGPFSELRYSKELKDLVLNSVSSALNKSTQKNKQTNDTIQSAIKALRAIVQLYQTRPYPEDDVFDLKPVMSVLHATSKRLALHWPIQQLLISTVVKMCFAESITGPGQIIDRSGIELILSCVDEQLSTLQRREDINWLARTVQDFLATSKDHRAIPALLRLYEVTEYQNTRLAELLCSFEDASVVPTVQQGLIKLLGKLSVTYQELASYLRGLLQLQTEGQAVLLELLADSSVGLKERCQIVLALAQHSAVTFDLKSIYWEVIDMGLFHPGLPYDGRKHAYQSSLESLSQSLVLLDSSYASQSLKQALMIYSGDEDICSVLESSLNQLSQNNDSTGNLVLDNKYLPNAVLEWAKKNRPSDFDESYYQLINTLKETLRTTDKNQIRVNKKILSQDLPRTVQLFIDMFHYSNMRMEYEQLKSTIVRLNNSEHEAAVALCFSHYSVFTVHQLLTELDQQLSAHTKHHLLTIINMRETSPWWLVDRVKVASLMKVLFGHLTGEQVSAVMTEDNKRRVLGIKVHNEDFVWATRLKEVLALLNKTS